MSDCIYRNAAERHEIEPQCEPTHLHPTEHPLPLQPPSPVNPPLPIESPPPTLSPVQPSSSIKSSSHTTLTEHPFRYLTSPTQPRTFMSNNPPPSRLETSLLRYSPVEYSRILQSSPLLPEGFSFSRSTESKTAVSPVQSRRDEVDGEINTDTQSSPEKYASPPSSSQGTSRAPQVYSPFMKLMETTANITID